MTSSGLAIAPLRGRPTGRKVVSRHVVTALRKHHSGKALVIDTAGPSGTRPVLDWPLKLLAYLSAALTIIFLRRRLRWVYIAGEAGRSIWFSSLLSQLANHYHIQNFLHHHASSYIERHHPAIAATCGNPRTVHLVICSAVGKELQARYGIRPEAWRTVHNAAWLSRPDLIISEVKEQSERGPQPQDHTTRRAVRLGLLSNLTIEKGIDDAIATLDLLLDQGVPCHLTLAGPANDHAHKLIREAQERFGDAIEYIGPVYGDQKKSGFFRSLDVFLFPGRYKHETQPLVVLEAMSFGVPVISTRRWCMADDVADGSGWLVPPGEPFPEGATRVLSQLDHQHLAHASRHAIERLDHLRLLGLRQFAGLAALLSIDGTSSSRG